MINFAAFEALIGFITGERKRQTQLHEEFLAFFQDLVKILPDDLAREFGKVTAPTMHGGQKRDYLIELTVTDLLWWRTIVDEGGRFIAGTVAVQRDIWDHLNRQLLTGSLTDEQRLHLLNLMNQPTD